ncbi:cation-transporting P-type ATPase [Methanohalobium sp.]|uniref:cation-transporting P-type ATPase n=1 Tax=Methanohalobium sp. TaxID=2837493 RepID=UPI0025F67144|nr:cation-transporting P-type ATPase [Methanohalobium sp.]
MKKETITIEEGKNTSISDLLDKLSSSKNGLSSEDTESRIDTYGYNEIPEEKVHPVKKLLSYFWGPIPWMI